MLIGLEWLVWVVIAILRTFIWLRLLRGSWFAVVFFGGV